MLNAFAYEISVEDCGNVADYTVFAFGINRAKAKALAMFRNSREAFHPVVIAAGHFAC